MPFVIARTSVQTSHRQRLALKERLGHAIRLVPGKSEAQLLLDIEDGCHMFFAGSDAEPIAYLEVSVFGNELHAGYDAFTADVTQAFQEVLEIRPDHVYVRFDDIAS